MADVEKIITDLEKQYWQAMVDKDWEKVLQLTADPCVVTGAMGASSITHDQYRHMMDDAAWELLEFTLEEPQVMSVTQDVAVIAYKVTENLVVDGKPLSLKAADASTWVRQNGNWVCALHTESILGDPFGRDRDPSVKTGKHPARKKSAGATTKRRPAPSRRRKVKG